MSSNCPAPRSSLEMSEVRDADLVAQWQQIGSPELRAAVAERLLWLSDAFGTICTAHVALRSRQASADKQQAADNQLIADLTKSGLDMEVENFRKEALILKQKELMRRALGRLMNGQRDRADLEVIVDLNAALACTHRFCTSAVCIDCGIGAADVQL